MTCSSRRAVDRLRRSDPALTVLELKGLDALDSPLVGARAHEMADLGEALGASSVLAAMRLVDCQIAPHGWAAMGAGVGASASLAELHVAVTLLGDAGARALADALAASRTLATLKLR